MILADMHTHCRFSGDSTADPRAMLQRAVEAGLKYYCFTDHKNPDLERFYSDKKGVILDTPAYRDVQTA